ncbi:MAG: hypothetical protein ACKOEN_05700 [Betaproteobacteria bacterium]
MGDSQFQLLQLKLPEVFGQALHHALVVDVDAGLKAFGAAMASNRVTNETRGHLGRDRLANQSGATLLDRVRLEASCGHRRFPQLGGKGIQPRGFALVFKYKYRPAEGLQN